ncbi:HAD family hydrolase [Cylindrospermopsis raciborskii]|uniref:HAD family hydrolase n=1 Tax=Cylindrospermopsis raciborskii TaxID=77022 RepID=UPI0023EFD1A6|nr:HAD hydrolase-like protein [Cylindrospermopsis raciborskii]
MISSRQIISSANLVFWDFDGVIKESVDVKTRAFEALFLPHGSEIAAKVRLHHEANGGVSRFEKMPLYLTWAGIEPTESTVKVWCDRFSDLVLQAVLESPWVPGVPDYLETHYQQQHFILVTATPQTEIDVILHRLGITHWFRQVFGAPTRKAEAIGLVLNQQQISPQYALMIGDAESDWNAAQSHGVPFILRLTKINRALQDSYIGIKFENLTE